MSFFKVFDLNENDEWVLTADWKAHSGSVWKVTWAHPEFGQVLATCSFDRMVTIWEEEKGLYIKIFFLNGIDLFNPIWYLELPK